MNRPASRRLLPGHAMANRACDAMKADEPEKACRLFEQSLALASEQYEMRALYAMALLIKGDRDAARGQAERACGGYPPSVRALCVCAQVYALMGDVTTARSLIDRAANEKPQGQDLRLMIYAMGEMGMPDRAAEYARLALQETPYDRELLHIRGVALKQSGAQRTARRGPVLGAHTAHRPGGQRGPVLPGGRHPGRRWTTRWNTLSGARPGVPAAAARRWWTRWARASSTSTRAGRSDPDFRQLMRWAVRAEDARLSRAAMTALTTIDHRESRSLLRALIFGGDLPDELKIHAALALKLQGRP